MNRRTPFRFRSLAAAGAAAVAGLVGIAPSASAYDIGTPPAILTFHGSRVIEGNLGTTTAPATLRLSAPLSQELKVVVSFYTPQGCSAQYGLDYLGPDVQVVTFAPGQTQGTASTKVVGDVVKESTECFEVKLSGFLAGSHQLKSYTQGDRMYVIDDDV